MIKDGVIGDVKTVQVSFGINLESVERVMKPELGGSVLSDIGIYTVNFADIVFMGEKPIKVSTTGILNEFGVDVLGSVTFIYERERVAQLVFAGSKLLFCLYFAGLKLVKATLLSHNQMSLHGNLILFGLMVMWTAVWYTCNGFIRFFDHEKVQQQ